ncbi:hypothetical protein JXI42_08035 [bacterium]|nr:hypothetical protein [bacterium]
MKKLILLLLLLVYLLSAINLHAQIGEPFDSLQAVKYLTFVSNDLDSAFFEAMKDAGSNWKELAEFVKNLPKERRDDGVWLLQRMPHLDRLVATNEILAEHVDYAYKIKSTAPYDIPDSLFRDYILTYRISSESVEAYRKPLYDRFYTMFNGIDDAKDVSKSINKWVADNISIGEHEFFGEIQTPLLTLKRREGTESEISILTTAMLKTFGIPSRNAYVRYLLNEASGDSWVEVFCDGEWLPLYPLHPEYFANFNKFEEDNEKNITIVITHGGFERNEVTNSYSKTGFVKLSFLDQDKPAKKFEHFSLAVYSDGTYFPLDDVGAEADTNGEFIAELGDGNYWVQTGVRDKTGSVFVRTVPFSIEVDETVFIQLDVTPQVFIDRHETKKGMIPAFNLPDLEGKFFSYNQFLKKPTVWVLFSTTSEPSKRMLPQIARVYEEFKDSIDFVGFIEGSNGADMDMEVPFRILIDENAEFGSIIIEIGDFQALENQLPIVLFTDKNSEEYELILMGYDLNIADVLRNKLSILKDKQ